MEISADMQQRMLATRAELQAVRTRMATLEQSKQMLKLTQSYIEKEQTGNRVWQGVGKMFVSASSQEYAADIATQCSELDNQLTALQKKEAYFNVTLEKMVQSVAP